MEIELRIVLPDQTERPVKVQKSFKTQDVCKVTCVLCLHLKGQKSKLPSFRCDHEYEIWFLHMSLSYGISYLLHYLLSNTYFTTIVLVNLDSTRFWDGYAVRGVRQRRKLNLVRTQLYRWKAFTQLMNRVVYNYTVLCCI